MFDKLQRPVATFSVYDSTRASRNGICGELGDKLKRL